MKPNHTPRSNLLERSRASACDNTTVFNGHRSNQPLRIIIADDHPVVLTGVEMILSSSRDSAFSIVAKAENADELIHHLGRIPCDLVISDYSMPHGHFPDGLALMGYLSRRSRLEASIYQSISARSSLSLTLSHQDYWQSNEIQRQYQFNVSTHHKGVGYNLFASKSLNNSRGSDRQIGLSVSLPLDVGHSVNATFDAQKNGDSFTQRASLSGTTDQNRLNYQASVSNDDHRQRSAALSLGYQAPFGTIGAGLTQGSDYRNVSLNASGALLLHADGIETGPYLAYGRKSRGLG